LIVSESINGLISLDKDIAKFKLSDLSNDEFSATINEIVLEKERKLLSSDKRCVAMNFTGTPKERRCSTSSLSNSSLCQRHLDSEIMNERVSHEEINDLVLGSMNILVPEGRHGKDCRNTITGLPIVFLPFFQG
jgi:hypothetical protein